MGIDAKVTPAEGEERDLSQCEIVSEVTIEMILNDLANGRNRTKIALRYAYKDENGELKPFEKWMVDEMFKDPALVGKTPFKGRIIPFTFKGSADSPVKSINNVGAIAAKTVETTPETPGTEEPQANTGVETPTEAPQSEAGDELPTSPAPIEVG